LSVSFSGFSQSVLDVRLDGSEQGKSLAQFITEWEARQPVKFFFMDDWLEGVTFAQSYQGQSLHEALTDLFRGTDLNFVLFYNYAIVLVKDPAQALQRQTVIGTALREQRKVQRLQLGQPGAAPRNRAVKMRGVITDEKSKEPLPGASIRLANSTSGVTADAEGRFELAVTPGPHVLSITFVNYEEQVVDVAAYADGEVNIALTEMPTVLEEIVVLDRTVREITTSGIGQTQISMKELKRAPTLLGEVDLIKQIQTLPGVTTAGEAASGFNVRGGSVDQNLILYDGIPVLNSSHAFGFFSAFNAEAIRDVSFYRGGIPAEHGGRISSVLNIRSKEGDYNKWTGSGGIGLISSNVMLSGPIQKEKTSVALSFRSTYSDWLINTIRTNYADLRNSSVFFYDGAIKLAHQFSQDTKLTVTAYGSHDRFKLQGDSTYQWNNRLISARFDYQLSARLGAALTMGIGTYSYNVLNENERLGFDLFYQISYPTFKADFHYQAGAHRFNFGAQGYLYHFTPGSLSPGSASSLRPLQMEQQRSAETGLYASDAWTLNEKYFVEAGFRFSTFTALGPGTVNQYQPGVPRSPNTLIGSEVYARGQSIQTYYGAEPRLSMRYSFSPSASFKIGYNRIYQYLHLITNTAAITPIDIWQPSNTFFKPQLADQLSAGLYKNFNDKLYETFVEVYYKEIDNLLDFRDGAELILNPYLEADLLQGNGRAYGVEVSATRTAGRLTGTTNYTFSRSLRTVAGPTVAESVNEGREYPSNFDQPHMVNLAWKYNISRRYFFTGNFTYRTGRPVTTPLYGFLSDNITVAYFSDRNQYRIPDYHRLDVALVREGNHKRKKLLDGTWTLSLYNVYARKNAYSVFFKDGGNGVLRPYQLAIIGTVLPSLSYNFRF